MKKIKKKKEEGSRFDYDLIIKWSKELLDGIWFIHKNSAIHRKIKPKFLNFNFFFSKLF